MPEFKISYWWDEKLYRPLPSTPITDAEWLRRAADNLRNYGSEADSYISGFDDLVLTFTHRVEKRIARPTQKEAIRHFLYTFDLPDNFDPAHIHIEQLPDSEPAPVAEAA